MNNEFKSEQRESIAAKEAATCPFRRLLRKSAGRLTDYAADKSGAIAVEAAILTPFILFGMLLGGSLALSVYNHQKIYAGAYSGASFLHDKIAAGDLSGLQASTNDEGEIEAGDWIKTAKLVIKDASGLPLDLDEIDVNAYCACPAMNPGELQNPDDADEFVGRHSFYEREAIGLAETGQICPTTCENGTSSRIIAEIVIDYESDSITGGTATIHEKLVTRLR